MFQGLQRKSEFHSRSRRQRLVRDGIETRRIGNRGHELPLTVEFQETRLVKWRHRRHHRFRQESRERRGTGVFRRRSFQDRDGRRRLNLGFSPRRSLYLFVGTFPFVRTVIRRGLGPAKWGFAWR